MSTNNLALPHYQDVGKQRRMTRGEIIGKNVARLREKKGLSPPKLAKLIGVRLFTIQSIEKGSTQKSKYLPDIARVLDVPLSEIDPSQKNASHSPSIEGLTTTTLAPGIVDVPVFGTTEGGSGIMVMSAEPVDMAERPPSLRHVKGAYGVIVVGESMRPILRPGDVVIVHPHKQPRREDICVFRRLSDGEFHSTVKEFRSQTVDHWLVHRYGSNPGDKKLKKADWPECHVVVTIYRS